MRFDISKIPFSRYGAYMCFNVLPETWHQHGLIFRTMRGVHGLRELLRFELTRNGKVVPSTLKATPTLLTMSQGKGTVDICFASTSVVRVRGHGIGLRMSSIDHHQFRVMPLKENTWQLNCPRTHAQYVLTCPRGNIDMRVVHRVRTQDKRKKEKPLTGPQLTIELSGGDNGIFEIAIEECQTTPLLTGGDRTFAQCQRDVEAGWNAWLRTTPSVPAWCAPAAELAMYVNWSAVVEPAGNLRRPTMLMSKNWMNECWSWDHAFNAIALSYRNPDLAWDQLMVPFDLMDRFGALPDGVNTVSSGWAAMKPPLHGWALTKMMRNRKLLTGTRLKQAYRLFSRWTDWWMKYRDTNGDGIPEYFNGCDSGWDNGTAFDGGCPVAVADLSAYLVLQMDTLSKLAVKLGKQHQAQRWSRRADTLLDAMIEKLWDGEQFVARRAYDGKVFPENGDCLLNHMAIMLGKRLPKPYRDKVAAALKPDGRFVTENGPATESPQSPLYVPDGYWRGPIWPPEVVEIVDGLARGGYTTQAREIAKRFCRMCVHSGFAENYNALSGEGLRDTAYTWASSGFLILAHEFLRGNDRR